MARSRIPLHWLGGLAMLLACLCPRAAGAAPDLTFGTSVQAPYSGDTQAAGSTFTVRYSVRCWIQSVSTNFYVQLSHCPQANPSGCTKLADHYVTNNFSIGQQISLTSPSLTVPDTAAAGTSYVQLSLDSTDLVSETVESNNIHYEAIQVTTLPDLQLTAAVVPDPAGVVPAASTFTATYTLANAASSSAVLDNFVVSYALCDSATSTTCANLGQQTIITDIPSGGTLDYTTVPLRVPWATSPGTHYVKASVDSTGAVNESDETNNDHLDPITVAPPVDGGAPDGGLDGPVVDMTPGEPPPDIKWFWPDSTPTRDSGSADAGTTGGGKEGCSFGVMAHPSALLPLALLLIGLRLRRRA